MVNLGLLLEDPETDQLHQRFRRDMESLIQGEDEAEDLEVASGTGRRSGRVSRRDRRPEAFPIPGSDALHHHPRHGSRSGPGGRLRPHAGPAVPQERPQPGARVSHAFEFLENEEVTDQGWIEAPENLRLTPDMFVAEIAGHSMQPLIPDGSLCVFRHGVAGSRQERLVLAESLDAIGNNKYAVKRYQSTKAATEEGWRHERIRLESLNPEYPSWDLDPDEEKYRIVAEFVRVLD